MFLKILLTDDENKVKNIPTPHGTHVRLPCNLTGD